MRINYSGVVTGTQVAYALICQRKLWLYTHGIAMELFCKRIEEAKTLHILSYPRHVKELEVPGAGVKIDFCENDGTIHEIKYSAAMEQAHIFQLAYYIKLFSQHNQAVCKGIIHYPRCRSTQEVILTQELDKALTQMLKSIDSITSKKEIPKEFPKRSICRKCAYYEFCFA